MKAIAEHPFRGGIEDKQVTLQIGGQNHRARGVQYASLQLGYLLHLPLGFILAAGVEKGVYAETNQQNLGDGPRDHGSRESPTAAQQQHQASVRREQQGNREKYGGRQPISKPGHSYSIDAGLINELSPSQMSQQKETELAYAKTLTIRSIGVYFRPIQ
jgi:hypothetical protein